MDAIDNIPLGLAVALGLGLLVGMQREWAEDKPIGLRSFGLIGAIGGLVGLFTVDYGGWVLAAGLLGVSSAIVLHSYLLDRHREASGMTTELAAIAVFLIGALATAGSLLTAVVLGGVVTVLLQWKRPMHAMVERIGETESSAVVRFVLLTLVVLPVLPNQTYGPYEVLNPFQIWLMVVLIVGLNLAGYFALRVSTGRSSALLGGVLGGLISSTATTVSFATRSRSNVSLVPVACVVILLASALVYARVMIETAAIAHELLAYLAGPIAAFTLLFLMVVGVYLYRFQSTAREAVETSNPAQFKAAFGFGALYSGVLLASAAANEHFGASMLYLIALISGLTDVDAITLSTLRLFDESRVSADTAWRVIFLASVANLVFKAGAVAVLGGPALRRRLLPALAGLCMVGFVMVALWP